MLERLGELPSLTRVATMDRLGRCYKSMGRPDLAISQARKALSLLDFLEPSVGVKGLRSTCLADLGNALVQQGSFVEAREAYAAGLAIDEELQDLRSQAVTLAQLAKLAMSEDKLKEAAIRYQKALVLFRQLGEIRTEAVILHQLGLVAQHSQLWAEAEQHFRESARLQEENGNLGGAAKSWGHLALLSERAGKVAASEQWNRKSIQAFRLEGNTPDLSTALNNLAGCFARQAERLPEARSLVEEALALKKTLDPGAAEIWYTFRTLAVIAEREAAAAADEETRQQLLAEARVHYRHARAAKYSFAGTRYELCHHWRTIASMVAASHDPALRPAFESRFHQLGSAGWTKLVAALRRILAGERDADALCEDLDLEDSMIVEAILQGIEDPSSLEDLQPDPPSPS
jgi:tetratricopeptide (TPR) repeat protein